MGENKGCERQDRTLFVVLGHLVGGDEPPFPDVQGFQKVRGLTP
jgi:hypothetical protein